MVGMAGLKLPVTPGVSITPGFGYFCILQNNPKMSAASDITLPTKCMDFCQYLVSQGMAFTFSLSMGSSFSFSLDTKEKSATSPVEVKKKNRSPSTMKRNAKNRKEFLGTTEMCDDNFNCDLCDYKAICKISLGKHMGKEQSVIPQLDVESPESKYNEDQKESENL